MITVTFHHIHFLEDDIHDGDIPRDDTRTNVYYADDVEEAAKWITMEGLTFASTGNDWAGQMDGPETVNYATGEMVESSAHLSDCTDAEIAAIIELVG